MVQWSIFEDVLDLLIEHFFGTHLAFSIIVLAVLLIAFLSTGAGLRYSVLFTLPLAAGLALGGFFGVQAWILNSVLIVVGLMYGFVLIRLLQ